VFSDELPQNVGPGEHVYVVVDGVAYRLVNDDGSDIGSTSDKLLPSRESDVHRLLHDQTVVSDRLTLAGSNSESGDNGGGLVDKTGLSVSKQGVPKQSDSMDRIENSLPNVSPSSNTANERAASRGRTVLAENDDEFEHLTSEPADKSLSHVSPPSDIVAAKPAKFVNSFLGFLCSESPSAGAMPVVRPPPPKIVVQARPPLRLRLQMPAPVSTGPAAGAVSTGPAVRPVSFVSPVIASSPRQKTVTAFVRSSPSLQQVVNQEPSTSKVVSPAKETASVEKVSAVTPVKPSRQPRVSKSTPLSPLCFCLLGELSVILLVNVIFILICF